MLREVFYESSESVSSFLGYGHQPLYRCKRHDYFTSALPWTQKGPAVQVSLGATAPIKGLGDLVLKPSPVQQWEASMHHTGTGTTFYTPPTTDSWKWYGRDASASGNLDLGTAGINVNQGQIATGYLDSLRIKGAVDVSQLYADLGTATPMSINNLREAFQIQKFYERQARGGTRYTEIIRSHFGVISPDARLQRPEYLGGSSSRINVNQVQQTSASDSSTPQGNLAAFAVGQDVFHGFTKSFVEHGYIIGLVNVRADITYQQGLNRLWSRRGKFDFYWPVFAHLGEQAVLNKEIFCDGSDSDDGVFGYQERYADYRYYPSIITGKLRSTDPQPLDYWHLAQKFENCPKLNSEFIQDTASYQGIKRASAVQNEPQFVLDSWFDLKCVRPMPVYGVPGLVDHF